jgi:hypothetical protein
MTDKKQELEPCSNPDCNKRMPSQAFYPIPLIYCSNCGLGVNIANELSRVKAWNELQRNRPEQPTPTPEGDIQALAKEILDDAHATDVSSDVEYKNTQEWIADKIKALFEQEREELRSSNKYLKLAHRKILQLEKELAEERGKHRWIPVSDSTPSGKYIGHYFDDMGTGEEQRRLKYDKYSKRWLNLDTGQSMARAPHLIYELPVPPGEQGEEVLIDPNAEIDEGRHGVEDGEA